MNSNSMQILYHNIRYWIMHGGNYVSMYKGKRYGFFSSPEITSHYIYIAPTVIHSHKMFNFKLSHVKRHSVFSYSVEFILEIPFPCLPTSTPCAIPDSGVFRPCWLGWGGRVSPQNCSSCSLSRACSRVSWPFSGSLFWTFPLLLKPPSLGSISTGTLEKWV